MSGCGLLRGRLSMICHISRTEHTPLHVPSSPLICRTPDAIHARSAAMAAYFTPLPPPPLPSSLPQDETSPSFDECPALSMYATDAKGSVAVSGSIAIGLGYAGNNNKRYGTNFNCTW